MMIYRSLMPIGICRGDGTACAGVMGCGRFCFRGIIFDERLRLGIKLERKERWASMRLVILPSS